jgi:hypothetical protein
MHTVITHGLYVLKTLFDDQKHFLNQVVMVLIPYIAAFSTVASKDFL